jgi:hypothetical protein
VSASSQRMAGEAVESVAFSGTFGPRSSGGSQNLTPHSAVSQLPPMGGVAGRTLAPCDWTGMTGMVLGRRPAGSRRSPHHE